MRSEHKFHISWTQVDQAVKDLHDRMVQHNYKPARILSIARGGMVPAVMLSHLFGIRDIGSLQLRSYTDDKAQESVVPWGWHNLDCAKSEYRGSDTLIVDDLWDSGKTHEFIRKHFPDAVTCTTFYKDRGDRSHHIVSFPGTRLPPGYWAVFPWELVDPANRVDQKGLSGLQAAGLMGG